MGIVMRPLHELFRESGLLGLYDTTARGTRNRVVREGKHVAAKIGFECVAPDHQQHQGSDAPDKLTIWKGEWAFCARSIRAEGHEWKSTGGEDYLALVQRTRHSTHAASGARAG